MAGMLRPIIKIAIWSVLVVAGATALYLYHMSNSDERRHELDQQKIRALEEQNRQMQLVVKRLKAQRRVARIRVLDQRPVNGKLQTTIKLVEYRRDGSELTPRQFVIEGDEVHFDAQIVKFRDEYVEQGDPLRGQSIIMLLRVYGAFQPPAEGFTIDSPGDVPEVYRGIDATTARFERDIWDNFWRLFNDKNARDAQGIRSLHGEGLWGRLQLGHVYGIELRPDGGMLNEEPEDPLYQGHGN